MPKARRTSHYRRPAIRPHEPADALDLAVAALQSALALASPKQTPAIARQLVAAAKERQAALLRAEARAREAGREAAEAKRESEIDAIVNVLGMIYPEPPANWGGYSTRAIAETMHEEGLTDELLILAKLAEEDSRPKFPTGVLPEDYWESKGAYARLEGEDEEEDDDEAEQGKDDGKRARDDPGMPRLRIL